MPAPDFLLSFVVIGKKKQTPQVHNNQAAGLVPVGTLLSEFKLQFSSFLHSIVLKQIEIFVLDGLASAVGDAVLKQ